MIINISLHQDVFIYYLHKNVDSTSTETVLVYISTIILSPVNTF